jgi:hypothetical protein
LNQTLFNGANVLSVHNAVLHVNTAMLAPQQPMYIQQQPVMLQNGQMVMTQANGTQVIMQPVVVNAGGRFMERNAKSQPLINLFVSFYFSKYSTHSTKRVHSIQPTSGG